jgi:hypothetical protein
MAPGFDQLSDHDYQDEEDNIDFSDLKERYDVRMEEGLDTFVVCRVSMRFSYQCAKGSRSSMVSQSSIKSKNPNSSNSY